MKLKDTVRNAVSFHVPFPVDDSIDDIPLEKLGLDSLDAHMVMGEIETELCLHIDSDEHGDAPLYSSINCITRYFARKVHASIQ